MSRNHLFLVGNKAEPSSVLRIQRKFPRRKEVLMPRSSSRTHPLRACAVLLLAMLLLAGCGGSSAPATTEVAPAALSPNTGTSSDAHGMAPAARPGAAAATRSPAGGVSAGAKPGRAA